MKAKSTGKRFLTGLRGLLLEKKKMLRVGTCDRVLFTTRSWRKSLSMKELKLKEARPNCVKEVLVSVATSM